MLLPGLPHSCMYGVLCLLNLNTTVLTKVFYSVNINFSVECFESSEKLNSNCRDCTSDQEACLRLLCRCGRGQRSAPGSLRSVSSLGSGVSSVIDVHNPNPVTATTRSSRPASSLAPNSTATSNNMDDSAAEVTTTHAPRRDTPNE